MKLVSYMWIATLLVMTIAAQASELEILPNYPGHGCNFPEQISDEGRTIIGTTAVPVNGCGPGNYCTAHGVIWDSNRDLHSLTLPGDTYSDPILVSRDGEVVVGVSCAECFNQCRVVVWTEGSSLQAVVGPGQTYNWAQEVSVDGRTIRITNNGPDYVWTHDLGFLDLLPEQDEYVLGSSYRVAESGSAVAAITCGSEGCQLVRWDRQNGLVPLGAPPGFPTGLNTGAVIEDISSDGTAIALRACGGSNDCPAFVWTVADGFEPVPFPDGASAVGIFQISKDSNVFAGDFENEFGVREGFLWSKLNSEIRQPPGGKRVYSCASDDCSVARINNGGQFELWLWTLDDQVTFTQMSSLQALISPDGSLVAGHPGFPAIFSLKFGFRSLLLSDDKISLGEGDPYPGMSGDGATVVAGSCPSYDGPCKATRWTTRTGLEVLDGLPGDLGVNAVGTSFDGTRIIGFSRDQARRNFATRQDAIVWTVVVNLDVIYSSGFEY